MKNVIYIPKTDVAPPVYKRIELRYRKGNNGWKSISAIQAGLYLNNASKIVYLGHCAEDGDMFAVYHCGYIMIFKGELNSGKY